MKQTRIGEIDFLTTFTPDTIIFIKKKLYFFVDRAREQRYGQLRYTDGTTEENRPYNVTLYILRDAAGKYKVVDSQTVITNK